MLLLLLELLLLEVWALHSCKARVKEELEKERKETG
jgi:hypothetical protein